MKTIRLLPTYLASFITKQFWCGAFFVNFSFHPFRHIFCFHFSLTQRVYNLLFSGSVCLKKGTGLSSDGNLGSIGRLIYLLINRFLASWLLPEKHNTLVLDYDGTFRVSQQLAILYSLHRLHFVRIYTHKKLAQTRPGMVRYTLASSNSSLYGARRFMFPVFQKAKNRLK